jgi:hypothetical protein
LSAGMNKPRLRLRLQADAAALPAIAYRDGGATAVGLVGLLRMAPSALIAPLVTPLADRGRRERVLIGVSTVRGITTGAAGIVVAVGGPVAIVYLLATLILEFTNLAVVFAVASAASLAAAVVLLRLGYVAPPRPAAQRGAHLMDDVAEGVRAIIGNRDLAMFTGLGMAQTFTRGARTVFTVVVPLDLLHTGEPGVGTLTGAIGAGAVVGSLIASLLVGSRRLAEWFGIGVALWGFARRAYSVVSIGSNCPHSAGMRWNR